MWEQFSTRLASWVNVTNPPVIVTNSLWQLKDTAYCTTRRFSSRVTIFRESILHTIAIIEDFEENYSSHFLKGTELIENLVYVYTYHVHVYVYDIKFYKLVNWT